MSENQTGNTPAGTILHVDPTIGDGIVSVPGGDMLLVADYVREGSDLILVGPEGQTIVIDNYFAMANPPALATAGGARVPGDLVQKLAGPMAPGQYAQAGGEQGEPIGQVETVEGSGQIVRADGTSEVLEAGVPIYQGDTVVTADGSTAGVIFSDKTTLSIGQDARMVIDEMVYDPAAQEGSQLFSLMQGAFVITSGEIGKLNPEDVTVRTPTTTIGIRGTKYGVSVDQEGGGTMITVLEGTVIVANDAGTIELNTVGQSTRASGFDAAPEAAFSLGASQLNEVYGLVLRAHPTQPPLQVNVDSQESGQGEQESEQQSEEDLEKLAEELDGVDTAAGGDTAQAEGEPTEAAMEQLAEQLQQVETAAGGEGEPTEAEMEQLAEQLNETETAAGDLADLVDALNVTDDTELTNIAEQVAEIATEAGGEGITVVPLGDETIGPDTEDDQQEASEVLERTDDPEPDSTPPTTPPSETVTPTTAAQGPNVDGGDVAGEEDAFIPLTLSASLADTDGAETLSAVTIGNIPSGAVLADSNGTPLSLTLDANGVGSITLPAGELAGLQIKAPENSAEDFNLTISATSTETTGTGAGQSSTTTTSFTVEVNAVADAPNLDLDSGASGNQSSANITGAENGSVALDISAALTDTDGSETLSITISGLNGGSLNAGTVNADGSVTLTSTQLEGLEFTPAQGFSGEISLSVEATATDTDPESGATSTSTSTGVINVSIIDFQDPALTVTDTEVNEDGTVALGIDVNHPDSSATISVTIANIPDGAVLTNAAGDTITINAGEVTLTEAQLEGLQITPPEDSADDMALAVTATATSGSSSSSASDTLDVNVTAVVDGFSADIPDEITLDAANVGTGAETIGGSGADTIDGTAGNDTIYGDFFPDEPLTSPLDIEHSLRDSDGNLLDIDGSETLSVTIGGVPEGVSLIIGGTTLTPNADGTYSFTVTPDSDGLDGLSVSAPQGTDDFTLSVTTTITDADTDPGDPDVTLPESFTANVTVNVADEGDDIINGGLGDDTIFGGGGDDTITFNIGEGSDVVDGGTGTEDTLIVNVSAEQSANADIRAALEELQQFIDGEGNLENGLQFVSETLGIDFQNIENVQINLADADASEPELSAGPASGDEDSAIALNISSALTDNDGSETLSVTIAGIPSGAVLLDANGNEIAVTNGSATLTPDQLEGLSITPPSDSAADIPLTVTATSTELATGDTATQSQNITVVVSAVVDAPSLTVTDTSVAEDGTVALDISTAAADAEGEVLSIEIANISDGAVLLDANNDPIAVTNGSVTLTPDQLAGLQITPPADSAADMALQVTTTASQTDPDTGAVTTNTSTDTLDVAVQAVADTPTLDLDPNTLGDQASGAAAGDEDTAIALDIFSALTDLDGSETLSIEIDGIPEGAVLANAAGETIEISDGKATLTSEQIEGLTITPPENSKDDFQLTVTSTATDTDPETGATSTASSSGTIDVTVEAVADEVDLEVENAVGNEDDLIALDISITQGDETETLSLTLNDIPDGARIFATNPSGQLVEITVQDGSAEISGSFLDNPDIRILPPANSSDDIELSLVAQTRDGGDIFTDAESLTVAVNAVADAPDLAVGDAGGNEDTAIALDISSSLNDLDGSESLSIQIANIPDNAVLAVDGVAIPVTGGTATLTADQLTNLTITPPEDFSGEFDLSITATATDTDPETGNTSTAAINDTITVDVEAVADAPELVVEDVQGLEDTAIDLDISSALTDLDGSEALSVIRTRSATTSWTRTAT